MMGWMLDRVLGRVDRTLDWMLGRMPDLMLGLMLNPMDSIPNEAVFPERQYWIWILDWIGLD